MSIYRFLVQAQLAAQGRQVFSQGIDRSDKGLAVVFPLINRCIGVAAGAAHGIARRFGVPIESLAKAADNIGKGNFEVVLPLSSATEMNATAPTPARRR